MFTNTVCRPNSFNSNLQYLKSKAQGHGAQGLGLFYLLYTYTLHAQRLLFCYNDSVYGFVLNNLYVPTVLC